MFRFEAKWTLEEEWSKVVKEAWNTEKTMMDPIQKVQRKLKFCKRNMIRWNSTMAQVAGKIIREKIEMLKE